MGLNIPSNCPRCSAIVTDKEKYYHHSELTKFQEKVGFSPDKVLNYLQIHENDIRKMPNLHMYLAFREQTRTKAEFLQMLSHILSHGENNPKKDLAIQRLNAIANALFQSLLPGILPK